MNTKELLKIVEERGLRIEIEEGRPVLKKPKDNEGLTDNLLAVLKRHRQRIIELLENEKG